MSIKQEYDKFYNTVEINLETVQELNAIIHSLWNKIDTNISDNSLKGELYTDAKNIIEGLNSLVENNKQSINCFNSVVSKTRSN